MGWQGNGQFLARPHEWKLAQLTQKIFFQSFLVFQSLCYQTKIRSFKRSILTTSYFQYINSFNLYQISNALIEFCDELAVFCTNRVYFLGLCDRNDTVSKLCCPESTCAATCSLDHLLTKWYAVYTFEVKCRSLELACVSESGSEVSKSCCNLIFFINNLSQVSLLFEFHQVPLFID